MGEGGETDRQRQRQRDTNRDRDRRQTDRQRRGWERKEGREAGIKITNIP